MSKSLEVEQAEPAGKKFLSGTVQLVLFLLVMLLLRTFIAIPYWIPSASMKPTLLVGDFMLVNKMAYGYGPGSCPSLSLLGLRSEELCSFLQDDGTRVFGAEPERGDIIVFRHRASDVPYIKRVIGLPGDRVRMIDGQVELNGTMLPQADAGMFEEPYLPQGSKRSVPSCSNEVFRQSAETVCKKDLAFETLPNGRSYGVLDISPSSRDNTGVYTVPANNYFVMGDNRDNSTDSRAQGLMDPGFIEASSIIGRAERVVFSWGGDAFWKVWDWRFDRFLHPLD